MATSRLFTLLGPSIIRNYSQLSSLKLNETCLRLSFPIKRYTCSALNLDSSSSSSTLTTDNSCVVSAAHPWPEWVSFVDGLKAKGYLTQKAALPGNECRADDEDPVVYTDVKLVKDACLSFARDRFDIFKSLSTRDVQAVVEKGCPNLFRKSVNSAKRLRAYVGLDEADVCGSCDLRGSCDRAYVMLSDSEADARTVDVVRIVLLYALDPLAISEENKPSGRGLVESSVRKLLSQLIELSETHPNPDLPEPASMTSQRKKVPLRLSVDESSQRKKQPLRLSVDERSKNVEMKQGDWVCTKCNFMNFAKNIRCLKCKEEAPPKRVSVGEVEMKKGDWNCPKCSFMNFASKRQCFRCEEARPFRQLKPGDWECPKCDFLNFGRNTVCRKCNLGRPVESVMDQGTWKKPY